MSDSRTKFEEGQEKNLKPRETKEDSIVKLVTDQFKSRSEVGIKKYGVTLDREDLSLLEWLQHSLEEKMDDVLYTAKMIKMLKEGKTGV